MRTLTFLRPTHPPFPLAYLITRTHQYLPEALLLPRRKDQDTRQVVVIPTHLLLTEEAHHLILKYWRVDIELCIRYAWRRIVRDEEVVEEGCHIVEDGLRVEKELCEQTQILRVELVLLAVDLVERVAVGRVDVGARRFGAAERTGSLCSSQRCAQPCEDNDHLPGA